MHFAVLTALTVLDHLSLRKNFQLEFRMQGEFLDGEGVQRESSHT